SGCPNSCSQPQLADIGIVTEKLARNEEGAREPRFALYRRFDQGLGESIRDGLTRDELLDRIRDIE
ncbi:MAG TPA: hypothetical protein VJ882_05440, partial [Desulfuromonadales bacterium]|nr:hypothetical protein [Desulfuromonadales bacterium]